MQSLHSDIIKLVLDAPSISVRELYRLSQCNKYLNGLAIAKLKNMKKCSPHCHEARWYDQSSCNAYFMVYTSLDTACFIEANSWGVLRVDKVCYIAKPEFRGRIAALQVQHQEWLVPGFTDKLPSNVVTTRWKTNLQLSDSQLEAFREQDIESMEKVVKYLRRVITGCGGCYYIYRIPLSISNQDLEKPLNV